jgi:hypothetical protein
MYIYIRPYCDNLFFYLPEEGMDVTDPPEGGEFAVSCTSVNDCLLMSVLPEGWAVSLKEYTEPPT